MTRPFARCVRPAGRYGAAKNPREKREALKAFNLAQDAYKERREEVMRIVGVEYVLHSATWIERQRKRRQHPGAQWSSERCAGYRAAMDLFEDWVLEIIRRAKSIVEYPPRVEPRKKTIGRPVRHALMICVVMRGSLVASRRWLSRRARVARRKGALRRLRSA